MARKSSTASRSRSAARKGSTGRIKKSGSYSGKSNKLGYGGRSAQLRSKLAAKGLPKSEIGAIIGKEARRTQSAPGMKNYHGKRAAAKKMTASKKSSSKRGKK